MCRCLEILRTPPKQSSACMKISIFRWACPNIIRLQWLVLGRCLQLQNEGVLAGFPKSCGLLSRSMSRAVCKAEGLLDGNTRRWVGCQAGTGSSWQQISSLGSPSSLPGSCSMQSIISRRWQSRGGTPGSALTSHLCGAGYKTRLNSQVKIGFGNFILVSMPWYHENCYAGGHDCQFCSETLHGWGGALDTASWDEDVLAEAWVEVHPATACMILAPSLLHYPAWCFQSLNKPNWNKSWLFWSMWLFHTEIMETISNLCGLEKKKEIWILFKQVSWGVVHWHRSKEARASSTALLCLWWGSHSCSMCVCVCVCVFTSSPFLCAVWE